MIIGQQRSRLTALGIDVWVPKEAVRQEKSCPSVWRDQQEDVHSPVSLQPIIPVIPPQPAPPVITPQPVPVVQTPPVEQIKTPPEPRVSEQLPAFSLQAFSLPHCVILLEATVLTEQQQRLWFNIQTALPSQFHELKWPFPLTHLQDSRGVGSYIQGFVDAIALDKSVISLGNIPYLQQQKIICLPGLQEMLQQPMLKKQLWQYMQNTHDSMED